MDAENIMPTDWTLIWTIVSFVIGTGLGVVALVYQILRNFKDDVNSKFEKHEKRFELIDQRLFLLCMGKNLPEILLAEKETAAKQGEL